MRTFEHFADRVETDFGLTISESLYNDWRHKVQNNLATFVNALGDDKSVWDVNFNGQVFRIGYVKSTDQIVRLYSVDGIKGFIKKKIKRDKPVKQAITDLLVFVLKPDAPSLGRFRFEDLNDRRVKVIRRLPQGKKMLDVFYVEAVNGKGRTTVPSRHFEGVDRGGIYEPRALQLQIGNVWFRS